MNSLKLMALMGTYFGICGEVGRRKIKVLVPADRIVSNHNHTQPYSILKFDGLSAQANYNRGILRSRATN